MNKLFLDLAALPLVFILLFTTTAIALPPSQDANSAGTVDLTGTWSWSHGEESLDLVLQQEGAKITGYHKSVGQHGAKADEVAEDSSEPSIKGDVRGTVATVAFRTGFPDADGHGTATLTLRGGLLYWEIVKSEGEHYLPLKARLTRAKPGK